MPLTADRHWGTWIGESPASVVHLPSGLGIRLLTYSAGQGRVEEYRGAGSVRYLERSAGRLRLQLMHAGSVVDVEVAQRSPFDVDVHARLVAAGEWSLRFWLLVAVGRLAPPTAPRITEGPMGRTSVRITEDADPPTSGAVDLTWRSTSVAVRSDPAPARAGTYTDVAHACRELEDNGYYFPHDDVPGADLGVLRFSGQEQGNLRLSIAVRTDPQEAGAAAARRLDDLQGSAGLPARHGLSAKDAEKHDSDAAAAAIRDVVGWNTVWDHDNARAYTTPSREWLAGKFGTYGVWLTDVAYAGLLASVVDDQVIAAANLRAVLADQQPAGNLPGLLTTHEEWVDRSQPPVVSFVTRRVLARGMNEALLEEAYPVLERSHTWWRSTRDPTGSGLSRYGSSATGRGTFRHTRQGALNESAMDNLPMFDGVDFDRASSTLSMDDPGLNSLLVLDAESLAALGRLQGRTDEATALEGLAEARAQQIHEQLWDAERGIFAARHDDGTFARSLSPTSFLPLLAGAADAAQIDTLIERHLMDEATWWGRRPLPASSRDDPASTDRVYWRGRIWPPLVYLVYEGLMRCGRIDLAETLADRAWQTFAPAWAERHSLEHFDPDGPEGDHTQDVDPFYTWGALLPLLSVLHRRDVSPWLGTVLDAGRGAVTLRVQQDVLSLVPEAAGAVLREGDRDLLRLEDGCRLHGVVVDRNRIEVTIPKGCRAVIRPLVDVAAVQVGERGWDLLEGTTEQVTGGAGITVDVGSIDADRRVEFLLGRASEMSLS